MSDILSTIIVALAVAAIACFAIFVLVRDKKMGRNSCGCKCSDCSSGCTSPLMVIKEEDK